jgi:hypothetical protein
VQLQKNRVVGSAPGDAAQRFGTATENPSLAPKILYPTDATVMPPNLADLQVHWSDSEGDDLYQVTVSAPFIDFHLYVTGAPNGSSWVGLSAEEWKLLETETSGANVNIAVRGMHSSGGAAGTATTHVKYAKGDLAGGLYYFSTTTPAQIYRHDFSRPTDPPEVYYSRSDVPPTVGMESSGCPGCHSISSDGTKVLLDMQVNTGSGARVGGVIQTKDKVTLNTPTTNVQWQYSAFTPDGSRMVTSGNPFSSTGDTRDGALTLRDGTTAAKISAVPSPGAATMPEFSPLGDALAYVVYTGGNNGGVADGRIVIQDYEPKSDTFGAVHDLVTIQGGNAYYPSWSPDAKWLLFDRCSDTSTWASYACSSAQLYVVPVDGSKPPILLASANVKEGITNSWPKFAPFTLTDASGNSIFWITFSSKRSFGARILKEGGDSQLWMAAFSPDAAASGSDPSAPAFWLPFQNMTTSNHQAQWTRTFVPIH